MLRQVLNSGGYVYAFIVGVAENRIGGRNPKDGNRDQAAGQWKRVLLQPGQYSAF
jgi:hypothetical protein